MKRIFFLSLFIILILNNSNLLYAQWVQSNGPFGGNVFPLAATPDESNLYVGTTNNGIFHSTDKGNTWTKTNKGLTSLGINSLAITNDGLIVFAGTNKGIFQSIDNGGNWMPINIGINNIAINTLNIDYNTKGDTCFFAGTNYGVFCSTNMGKKWTQMNNGLTDTSIIAFAFSDTNIYALTYFSGVFRSTDNGQTWKQENTGLLSPSTFNMFSCIAAMDTTIYVGTSNGIFKTTDKGKNWYIVKNTGLNISSVSVLTVLDSTLYGAGIVGGVNAVFQFSKYKKMWTESSTGLTNAYFNSIVATNNGSDIFISSEKGIFRSLDTGHNWAQANTGLTGTYVRALSVFGKEVMAGTFFSGIFRSINNCESWQQVNNNFSIFPTLPIPSVFASFNNESGKTDFLYGTSGKGIFLSTDNGLTWNQSNNGLSSYSITSLAVLPVGKGKENLFAGTWYGYYNSNGYDGSNIYVSTDDGANWTLSNNALPYNEVAWSLAVSTPASDSSSIFAATPDSGIYRSTDKGKNWIQVNDGMTGSDIRTLIVAPRIIIDTVANKIDTTFINYVFGGSDMNGIYVSFNNGQNWFHKNKGLTDTTVYCMAATSNGSAIFAGTGHGVFVSTNYGDNWNQVDNGLTNTSISSLAVSSNDSLIFAGTSGGSGVWKSSIAYLTSVVPVELTALSAETIGCEVRLYWQTATEVNNYGFEIQRSSLNPRFAKVGTQGGWQKIGFVKGAGSTTSPKQYSFVDKNPGTGNKIEYRLKQLDYNGTYKYSKIVEVSLSAPKNFILMQNYPNPFNPTSTIRYEIPKAAHVSLKVYDILGNVVETLVDKEQQAGRYSVKFPEIRSQGSEVSQLASGVYLYRLQAGSFVQTKKMILLK